MTNHFLSLSLLLCASVFTLNGADAPASALSPKQTDSTAQTDPQKTRQQRIMDAIGAKYDKAGNMVVDGKILISKADKSISFSGFINIRQGPIEVLISTNKGRTHESLLISDIDPFKLQLALILAGYRNGPIIENAPIPMGTVFDIFIVTKDGKRINVDDCLRNITRNTPMEKNGYVFIGSNFLNNQCVASTEGNIVNINSNDSNSILNAKLAPNSANDQFDAVSDKLPPPVKNTQQDPAHEDYYVSVNVLLVPRKIQPGDKKPTAVSAPTVTPAPQTQTPAVK